MLFFVNAVKLQFTRRSALHTIQDKVLDVVAMLGAEGDGLRQLTRRRCDDLAAIPMAGAVESLNVSVASGICLYESVRQRTGGKLK